MKNTDNENEQTVTTNSVDVKDTVQLKNEENNLSIEVKYCFYNPFKNNYWHFKHEYFYFIEKRRIKSR